MSITISPTTLGSLTVDTALSPVTLAASGGTSPYVYAVAAQAGPAPAGNESGLNRANPGALPLGLSLNSTTGVVSGTPQVQGDYLFIITVTDATGAYASFEFSGSVARNTTEIGNSLDLAADNYVSATVAERVSGVPQTGRLTLQVGGFDLNFQGGDTLSLPKFEYDRLKLVGVVQ